MYVTPSTFFESVMSLLALFSEIHAIPFLSFTYIFMPLSAGCLGSGTEGDYVNTHILNAVIVLKLENINQYTCTTHYQKGNDDSREGLREMTSNILMCNKEMIERLYVFCFLHVRENHQAERNSKPQTSAAEIVACQPKICGCLKGQVVAEIHAFDMACFKEALILAKTVYSQDEYENLHPL